MRVLCYGPRLEEDYSALDEIIIRKDRKYSTKHNLIKISLVKNIHEKTIATDSSDWLEECFNKMDKADFPERIEKRHREDTYRTRRLHRYE
jgi:hypothetical protein